MRSRALAAVLLLVALAALARGRGPAPRPDPLPVDRAAAPPRAAAASPRPVDPASLRDVFRFADEEAPRAHAGPGLLAETHEPVPAEAPAGPRLVGLVRRAGRLVAALAADGEVVLAGPGETAGGVTVLSVSEDGVRVRRADGTEATLILD